MSARQPVCKSFERYHWVIHPDEPTDPIEQVEIEAIFSKAVQVMAWLELQDDSVWRQGWV